MHCSKCGRGISGVSYEAPDGGQYCVKCAATLPVTPSNPVPSRVDLSAGDLPTETKPPLIREGTELVGRDRSSYASFGRRLAAYLLDTAICFSLVLAAGFIMRLLIASGAWAPAAAGAVPGDDASFQTRAMWNALGLSKKLLIALAFVLSTGPVYFALFEASPWQATFGKRLLNMYVARDDGERLSIARSFGRWTAKSFLNQFGLVLISLITIAATKNRKGLHDFAAGTVLVGGRQAPGAAI